MADFDYSDLVEIAQGLIDQFGRSAILVKPGAPTGPPYDPQPGMPTEHTISLVQLEYSMTNRDSSLIQVGDKLWLVSTAGEAPQQEHTVKDGGLEYQILDVQLLMPGDTTMLFQIHGRR